MTDRLSHQSVSESERQYQTYQQDGWVVFDSDPAVTTWVQSAIDEARKCVADPSNRTWFRHGDTWFAGVNILDNDVSGAVSNGLPVSGNAVDFIRRWISENTICFDKAQVSVYYPGYPKPSAGENSAAFGFRLRRDAAHIDGLLPVGAERRRFLREHHHYILGIPMGVASPGASPFVAWRGSHHVVRKALSKVLEQHDESLWNDVDLTDTYQQTRRQIFDECERVELPLKPGQALVAHRLVLHGSAPWHPDASAGKDGRMICFFRPPAMTATEWLRAP